MKERLKSVLNYRSYPQVKLGIRFLDHPVEQSWVWSRHSTNRDGDSGGNNDRSKRESVRTYWNDESCWNAGVDHGRPGGGGIGGASCRRWYY